MVGKERLRTLLEQYVKNRATWQETEEMLLCTRLPDIEAMLQECIEAALKTRDCEMLISMETWAPYLR